MKRKKLRAATARRRSLGMPDELDYEQMSEPNMKLSRALLIVLLLHVVAVAGIVAFNTIKTREAESGSAPIATAPVATPLASASAPEAAPPRSAQTNEITKVALRSETKAAEKPTAPEKKSITETTETKAPSVADSGKIYTVVKGDNPVTIARHLRVSYSDLMELNQIGDPRKLQIGQKLRIPESKTKAKHDSD